MKKIIALLALSLVAVAAFAQRTVLTPEGPAVTEVRKIGSFDKIAVSDGINIRLSNGERQVEMTASKNILPYVECYTSGSTLVIKLKNNTIIKSRNELYATISVPSLKSIAASAGSRVDISGSLDCKSSMDIALSSGAKVIGNLNCDNFNYAASSGAVMAGDVAAAGHVEMAASGGGRFVGNIKAKGHGEIAVSGGANIKGSLECRNLDIATSGGGSVDLKGKCEDLSATASGGSSINCFDLVCRNLKGSFSGGGKGEFTRTGNNKMSASGGGRFFVKDAQGNLVSKK